MPSPLLGTFGAFIKVRSPIYSKRALFDIGISGPIAGFVFLLPALAIGLAFSKVIPGIATRAADFRHSRAAALMGKCFPGHAGGDIYLHPVARAAWVGMFTTALNLLPIGQLDGGHILYSFFPGAIGFRAWWPLLLAAAGLLLVGLGAVGAGCCGWANTIR
jgi:membrane-associated protease RseP (regulator of RpoE activity)